MLNASDDTDPVVAHASEAAAAIRDPELPPAIVADRVLAACHKAVEPAPPTDRIYDEDTPGLEGFLWYIWGEVVAIAAADASTHDRLAGILSSLKAKGRTGCESWHLWGADFDWANLPVFGLTVREHMNGPTTAPVQASEAGHLAESELVRRYVTFNAFVARLWTLGVQDGAFLAIATMRMELEPLSLPDPPITDETELGIEDACAWLRVAGRRMFECREILGPKGNPEWDRRSGRPGSSGGTWDGVDGFHPARWEHWKQILRNVVRRGELRPSVIEAAKSAVEAMEQVERHATTSGDVA